MTEQSAAPKRDGTICFVHELSVFGEWCYWCGVRKRWWAFWRRWSA